MQDPTTDIAAAFGEGPLRTWAGRQWNIRHLNILDLIVLQKRIGGIDNLDTGNVEHMLLFFYLVLRKSDPGLSEADVENEQFNLTENQVGRMLTLKILQSSETVAFINELLRGSGLAEEEAPSPNPKAGARKKQTSPA